jgi:hypothetical protein
LSLREGVSSMGKAKEWYRWIIGGSSAPSKRSRAIVGSALALVVLLAVGGAVLSTSPSSPTTSPSNGNSTVVPDVPSITTTTVGDSPTATPTTKPTGPDQKKTSSPTTVPAKKSTSKEAASKTAADKKAASKKAAYKKAASVKTKSRPKYHPLVHRVNTHRRVVTKQVTVTKA